LIRTPKQLVTVVILAFVVPLAIILLAVQFITGGIKVDPNGSAMSDKAVAERMDVLNSGTPAQIADTSSTKSITVTSDPGESHLIQENPSTILFAKRAILQVSLAHLRLVIKQHGPHALI